MVKVFSTQGFLKSKLVNLLLNAREYHHYLHVRVHVAVCMYTHIFGVSVFIFNPIPVACHRS